MSERSDPMELVLHATVGDAWDKFAALYLSGGTVLAHPDTLARIQEAAAQAGIAELPRFRANELIPRDSLACVGRTARVYYPLYSYGVTTPTEGRD